MPIASVYGRCSFSTEPDDLPRLQRRLHERRTTRLDLNIARMDVVRQMIAVVTATDRRRQPRITQIVHRQLRPPPNYSFTVGGTNSARTSVNGVIVRFPGNCRRLRMLRRRDPHPDGFGPATALENGVAKNVNSTVPVVPGYSRSVCGSTTVHGATSPTGSNRYSIHHVTGVAQPQPHLGATTGIHSAGGRLQRSPKAHAGDVSRRSAPGSGLRGKVPA